MVADRAGRRSGDDEVVLAAERSRGDGPRTISNDHFTLCRSAAAPSSRRARSAKARKCILDVILGQRLERRPRG